MPHRPSFDAVSRSHTSVWRTGARRTGGYMSQERTVGVDGSSPTADRLPAWPAVGAGSAAQLRRVARPDIADTRPVRGRARRHLLRRAHQRADDDRPGGRRLLRDEPLAEGPRFSGLTAKEMGQRSPQSPR